jgi:putative PIN family toxin of toxin-antitoxin system
VRVFLDTNVLVSAFAARGLCADLLELVLLEHEIVLGTSVVRELEKALREKVKLPDARAAEIVEYVSGEAVQVVPRAAPSSAPVDPDDALVLGEAIAAGAEVFVTGDAALVRVGMVENVRVVTPRQFWEMLQSAKP